MIVPLVLDLLEPRSIVDVGCGTGEFLAVARERGVSDVLGLDGPWVEPSQLRIPPIAFRHADLEAPLALDRRFDVALSLEVGEHLSPEAAATFVASLVASAPAVVFSAAIPGQGGTHHVNEQWPAYWVERFAAHGYAAFDPFRHLIWADERIPFWYRQNIGLFVSDARLTADERLRERLERERAGLASLVHPELFLARVSEESGRMPAGRDST